MPVVRLEEEAPIDSQRQSGAHADPVIAVLIGDTFKLEMTIRRLIPISPVFTSTTSTCSSKSPVSNTELGCSSFKCSDAESLLIQGSEIPNHIPLIVSIDTCAGASLIRKNCIPKGVPIKPSEGFSFRVAQGKKLQIEGIVTLSIGETIFPAVDLFVATDLVVRMLLGAP